MALVCPTCLVPSYGPCEAHGGVNAETYLPRPPHAPAAPIHGGRR